MTLEATVDSVMDDSGHGRRLRIDTRISHTDRSVEYSSFQLQQESSKEGTKDFLTIGIT